MQSTPGKTLRGTRDICSLMAPSSRKRRKSSISRLYDQRCGTSLSRGPSSSSCAPDTTPFHEITPAFYLRGDAERLIKPILAPLALDAHLRLHGAPPRRHDLKRFTPRRRTHPCQVRGEQAMLPMWATGDPKAASSTLQRVLGHVLLRRHPIRLWITDADAWMDRMRRAIRLIGPRTRFGVKSFESHTRQGFRTTGRSGRPSFAGPQRTNPTSTTPL